MLSRLHASNTISVYELLNPSEENVLMEDPTDEDFCRIDTTLKTRLEAGQNRGGRRRYSWSTQTPENISAEKLRLKLMAQLVVSADVMGISSREDIGLRSTQREF
ncbi:hypothetical protein JG687_00011870 [Phytophthora cactorum]|uniref:Uncharacterized protein n=1 Tax=Phytophthora cactorum TaxID=29920 RepID=A0A8T1U4N0_9STRA|nr:hypothetical protein JG687_00011870 [Phytophthora cactorum]